MLREAFSCGLLLDPRWIPLQPALFNSPPITSPNLLPRRLKQLQLQIIHGEAIDQDNVEECQELTDKHLFPSQVAKIVNLAAEHDTGPKELSLDAKRALSESLTRRWEFQERVVRGEIRFYTDMGNLQIGPGELNSFMFDLPNPPDSFPALYIVMGDCTVS